MGERRVIAAVISIVGILLSPLSAAATTLPLLAASFSALVPPATTSTTWYTARQCGAEETTTNHYDPSLIASDGYVPQWVTNVLNAALDGARPQNGDLVLLRSRWLRAEGTRGVHDDALAAEATDAEFVNLASAERTEHILVGDATGGGHLWPGAPGKTPFPEGWSGDQIMHHVSDIATDPALTWVQQTGRAGSLFTRAGDPARFFVIGERGGIQIKVILEPAGEGIITAHPIGAP